MCKNDLPDTDFAASGKKKNDGLQYNCRSCQKEYRRNHYLNNRQKYIDKAAKWNKGFYKWWFEYKGQYKCGKCPESHQACIHFHHPNKDKEEGVAYWIGQKNRSKVMQEIAKCVPLCANCHSKLHWDERHPI